MIIFGAGLAGLLAGNMFRQFTPTIYEAQQSLPNNHNALLRFRTDEVSKETAVPFQKVLVRKNIMFDNTYLDFPNPYVANMYAFKVTGEITDRSIWNIDPVDRYVAPGNLIYRMSNGLKIEYGQKILNLPRNSGPIISTLPMPIMMDIVDWKHKPQFGHKQIWSWSGKIKYPNVSVCQTIYYPDLSIPHYRSSIVNGELIIEFISDPGDDLDNIIGTVAQDFGFPKIQFHEQGLLKCQKYGKILPIDESMRQEFIYTLTRDYNIYSLGRFATWRQILLDDVVKDAKFIRKLIDVEEGRKKYLISAKEVLKH